MNDFPCRRTFEEQTNFHDALTNTRSVKRVRFGWILFSIIIKESGFNDNLTYDKIYIFYIKVIMSS